MFALLCGRNLPDTLHERVGDEEDIRGRSDLHQTTPNTGVWGGIIGTTGQQNSDPAGIFSTGRQYKYDFLGLRARQDLWRGEHADGSRDHAGVHFAVAIQGHSYPQPRLSASLECAAHHRMQFLPR